MQFWQASKKSTILITGTSRGLGLEFVKQYAENNFNIIACCRAPSAAEDLQHLKSKFKKNIEIHSLDVASASSIEELIINLSGRPIDILLNNAGIYGNPHQQLGNLEVEDLIQVYATNAIAPLKLSEALIDNLKLGSNKIIACVTSLMGSIGDNTSGAAYAYRASKSGLNMLMRTLAVDLDPLGIRVLLLHPGWVKTDMGGQRAPLEIPVSVNGMRQVIASKTESGVFYDYQGRSLPW